MELQGIEPLWIDTWQLQGIRIVDPQKTEMVSCQDITVNFNLRNWILGDASKLDGISMSYPALRLAYHKDNGKLNLDEFLNRISPSDTTSDNEGGRFSIRNIKVKHGLFVLEDELSDYSEEVFDENHFELASININIDGLETWGDSLVIDVEDLNCKHTRSGLTVHKLQTLFTYSEKAMVFAKLRLDAGNSILRDSLIFTYDSFGDFKSFIHDVRISGTLNQSMIDTKDLAIFNSFFDRYNDVFSLSTQFSGTIDRMQLKSAQIGFGRNSIITGDFSLIGLPRIDETLLGLNCRVMALEAGDLLQYIGFDQGQVVTKLGRIVGSAEFTGFYYDFVAEAKLQTQLGELQADINLKLDGEENTSYKGRLQTKNFDMGRWLSREQYVGQVSMDGNIEGKGLSIKNAKIKLNASVDKIELLAYPYRSVKVNASLAASFFDGWIQVLDSNLMLEANGKVNLEKGKEKFDLNGELFRSKLNKLFFMDYDLNLATKFQANSTGLEIDSLTGYLNLEQIGLRYINKDLKIKTLQLVSEKNEDLRVLQLKSSLVNATLEGNFYIKILIDDISKTLYEYTLGIENDKIAQRTYYKNLLTTSKESSYYAQLTADIPNLNSVFKLFSDEWYLSPNTKISGSVQMDNNRQIQLFTTCDTLIVNNQHFFQNSLDVYTSKSKRNPEFLAMVTGQSEKQTLASSFKGENLLLEAIWSDSVITFNHQIRQADEDNHAFLNGVLTLSSQGYLVEMDPSHFKVLDNVWQIAPGNLIRYSQDELSIQNFRLVSSKQSLEVKGAISPDSLQFVTVDVNDFELKQVSPLIKMPISGIFNGHLNFSELFTRKKITWTTLTDSLVVDEFYVGNVVANGNWVNEIKQVQVAIDVERDQHKLISLEGYINPALGKEALNLTATFREARLELLEPFFKDDISEVSGKVVGAVSVTGPINKPVISGAAEVKNARLRINYLNTVYTFSDKIYFLEQEFGLRNVKLYDERGNTALVRRAAVLHDGFDNMQFEVGAVLDNFMILNQKENLEELYYATAVVSGNFTISGTAGNLVIKANAVSNKGTRIFIPINSGETFAQQEYISFLNPEKKENVEVQQQTTTNLTGIEMDFNLEITPDAQFEIIFDKRAGDIIKGTGQGKMQMQIDTRGDFNLMGNYEILDGTYNFTFLNVVNKKFNINPGSRISWNGDPANAIMDIKASYTQNVSLLPILNIVDSALIQQPEIRRRYPTELFLNLTGPLMSPSFKFDIKITNFPQNIITPAGSFSLNNSVMAFYSNIQNNEQEMNRQVFSLIALRRLSPDNSFAGSNQMVGNSLTELLSNQLSSWMSQVNENFEIDLDLNGLDADALNTMQVRLSYSLLNGKIRVTRDGTFTNNQNQASLNSIMGDWMVEYRIDDRGKFRIKAFNRNNYNVINSNINNTNTAGVSIIHSETFDRLSEIIGRKNKEAELTPKKEKAEPEEEPLSKSDKEPQNSVIGPRKEEE